eukprot:4626724-Amphidinium_carterae.1
MECYAPLTVPLSPKHLLNDRVDILCTVGVLSVFGRQASPVVMAGFSSHHRMSCGWLAPKSSLLQGWVGLSMHEHAATSFARGSLGSA